MTQHHKINYVEFPSCDLDATRSFFENCFDWSFVDFGPEYTSFSGQGIDGGFFKSGLRASTDNGSALVVLYSDKLEDTLARVENAGGRILKPIFSFPGGRRFHFAEPAGNEFAVWGESST